MTYKTSLVSLKMEIPVVETTKEGFLAGGFLSVKVVNERKGKPNLNCIQVAGGTCAGKAPLNFVGNVNCPLPAKSITCQGVFESKTKKKDQKIQRKTRTM